MVDMSKRWKILLAIIALIVVGVLIWSPWKSSTKKIETFSPEIRDIKKVLSVSGTTDAYTKATLRFLAGGKIITVGAKQGDSVKKNQVLAGIDKRELEKSFAQQLNTFTATRVDFDQTIDTYKDVKGVKSVDRILDKNQLTLENAVLSVEMKDLALKNTVLRAPFAGVLVTAPATFPNAILAPSDVFTVVDPESLFFDVEVDESTIGLVQIGQTATIVFDAYPDEKITSEVLAVAFQSSQGDSGTVFRVRLQLPANNNLLKFKLGMNGTADIQVDQRSQVLTVPLNSVVETGGKSYVEVLNAKGLAEKKEFKKGMETEEFVEVQSGLSTSDKVIKK